MDRTAINYSPPCPYKTNHWKTLTIWLSDDPLIPAFSGILSKMNNEKITKFLMDTLQPKIYKKTDCIAFTTQNHVDSVISYLPRPSGKLHVEAKPDRSANQRFPFEQLSKAEYLQKSFPKFLKIDSEKLVLAGNDYNELTSNSKTLSESFRENFENHKDFAKKDTLGWRNENYGVYGNSLTCD